MGSLGSECDYVFDGLFVEFSVFLPIVLLLELALFVRSICIEIRIRKSGQQRVKRLRTLFYVLQMVALYWMIMDLFIYVFDPLTGILRNTIGCDMALSPKIVPAVYYTVYMFQIVLRLDFSFKGSYLALRKLTLYGLNAMVFVPFIGFNVFLFISYRHHSCCSIRWNPPDLPRDSLSFCFAPISGQMVTGFICGLLWIVLCNLILAVLFGTKLRRLLSNAKGRCDDDKKALKYLIIKNSILSVFGSLSTALNYSLWIASIASGYSLRIGALFLYLDLWTNCLAIGLMFKSSEMAYKRCCRCCILLLLLRFDQSASKMDEQSAILYVDSLGDDDHCHQIRASSIPRHSAKDHIAGDHYIQMHDVESPHSRSSSPRN